jgi:hypothetical protein
MWEGELLILIFLIGEDRMLVFDLLNSHCMLDRKIQGIVLLKNLENVGPVFAEKSNIF